jgi:hypothetical protein
MTRINRLAVHNFSTETNLKFDPVAFSRFKYGSLKIANQFGETLAHRFCQSPFFTEILTQTAHKKIIVLPPPYINVPTAGYFLTQSFFNKLNQYLFEKEVPNAWFAKIYRQKSYFVDYGNMTAIERRGLLSDETFQVDAAFLKDNICLFIDDIRITGAH